LNKRRAAQRELARARLGAIVPPAARFEGARGLRRLPGSGCGHDRASIVRSLGALRANYRVPRVVSLIASEQRQLCARTQLRSSREEQAAQRAALIAIEAGEPRQRAPVIDPSRRGSSARRPIKRMLADWASPAGGPRKWGPRQKWQRNNKTEQKMISKGQIGKHRSDGSGSASGSKNCRRQQQQHQQRATLKHNLCSPL